MSASLILFEPRRVARLAAAAVTASARGFGGTLTDQRRLHLVHGKSATAGQILATLIPAPEGDHVQS
jgi:hypothetical protein